MSVVYGYSAAPTNDEFLNLAEQCVDILTNRVLSGGGVWPVDIIPALRHIPTWFPGAGFKRNAIKWKAKIDEFADRPYEYVKNSIVGVRLVTSVFLNSLVIEIGELCLVILLYASPR